jgi:hypothetical protein
MSFSVIGGAPGVMSPGNYVRNFPPTLASYLAGVKAAMLRPPVLRTILLLLLALPFSFSKIAHAAADQQLPANWVPQGFEALGQRAAFHTDFTFDRAMLQVAGYFIGDGDQGTRNAIAKLNSISVHSYHFAAPGLYDRPPWTSSAGSMKRPVGGIWLRLTAKVTPSTPGRLTYGSTLLTWM